MTCGATRLQLIDELVELLRAIRTKRSGFPHQLVIGPRGAGKTHLLRVVVHRAMADPALRSAWWPIVLPEEIAVRGPAQLPREALRRLSSDLEAAGEGKARAVCLEALERTMAARTREY